MVTGPAGSLSSDAEDTTDTQQRRSDMAGTVWNPWKMTAIGLDLAGAVALITGVVVANWSSHE